MRCSSLIHFLYRQLGKVMLVVTVMVAAMSAQADVLVSPLRVYLDDDQRSTTVIMRNPGDGPRTYRLEWIEQRMSEDGVYSQYKEGETPKHSPASPYLRLSPRQITVQPGTNQTVRIQYRPGKDMKPGEYRSHLLFSVVPELSEPTSVSTIKGEGEKEGMTLKLSMQMSVAIPVVVGRQLGEPPEVNIASVEPMPATAPGQSAKLSVLLQRSGLAGSFGRVVVDMQLNADSPVERIGQADNISVFADVDQRRLLLSLRDEKIPAGTWLRVAYEGMGEYAGRLWDEQVFQTR